MQQMCSTPDQNDSILIWAKKKSCVVGKSSRSYLIKNILTSKSLSWDFGVANSTQPKCAWVVNLSSVLLYFARLKVKNVSMPGMLKHSTKCSYMLTLMCRQCHKVAVKRWSVHSSCSFYDDGNRGNLGGGCVGNWHAVFAYTRWRIRDKQEGG